jgi:hypothetical protein
MTPELSVILSYSVIGFLLWGYAAYLTVRIFSTPIPPADDKVIPPSFPV